MVVLRVVMMPYYLQAFLNIAQDRLTDLHKEAGRILNIDLQKKVYFSFAVFFKTKCFT
jgi:hypothetical protein